MEIVYYLSNLIYKKGTITTSGSSASYRLYVDVDPKKLIILATALEDNGTVAVVKETISITFSTTAAAINKSMDVDYILFFK